MNLLILGGTTEATALARALAGDARFNAMLSFAGVTRRPVAQPIPTGWADLAAWSAWCNTCGSTTSALWSTRPTRSPLG
jgi:hypothetical protein